MSNFVIDLLINAFVALVAAVFAVRISMYKFATQKWWERREEAYAKIVGILSRVRVYLGNLEDHYFNNRKLNHDERNSLSKKLRKEIEEIELVTYEGAFRISDKSNDALNQLVKTLNQYSDEPIDDIGSHFAAIKKCLDIVKLEAERDLSIKRKWYKL